MILFNRYEQNKGKYHISPTLLWEYDLRHFDWQQARSIVVQRVIERGCAEDYFAAFDLYGGIAGFREILREVSTLSEQIWLPNQIYSATYSERYDRRGEDRLYRTSV